MIQRRTKISFGILALLLGGAPQARALSQNTERESTLAPPEADQPAEADGDGARRDLELFWLRANAGYTALDLTTFQADGDNLTADLIPSRLAGPTVGLGVGVRLLFISLAARGSVAFFSDANVNRRVGDMQLWSLDGDIFLHLLSGYDIEPYVVLGGGYSTFGEVNDAMQRGGYSVSGANLHAGVGLDIFVSEDVSIGGQLSGSLTFLARPGVSAQDLLTPEEVETVGQARARLLEADGSSIGTGYALVLGPSFHF
jgi:hypothetical protein